MENNKEILELIKTTARGYIADAEVMLFGSSTRENSSTDSDFEILLITSRNYLQNKN